jgi:hypothetical protein
MRVCIEIIEWKGEHVSVRFRSSLHPGFSTFFSRRIPAKQKEFRSAGVRQASLHGDLLGKPVMIPRYGSKLLLSASLATQTLLSQMVRDAGSSWFPPPEDELGDSQYTIRKALHWALSLNSGNASILQKVKNGCINPQEVVEENNRKTLFSSHF